MITSIDIPKYADLFIEGKLSINKLVIRSYSLDEVNEAFAALEAGEVTCSVIRFWHQSSGVPLLIRNDVLASARWGILCETKPRSGGL